MSRAKSGLLLTGSNPRAVMPFGDADTAMAQEDRHTFQWDAVQQELNGKRVAESVRVSILNTGQLK